MRAQLGRLAFRLYMAAYFALLGFGFLGELGGPHARPVTIAPRTTAVVGAVVLAGIIVTALFGRVAVALRPSPVEVQLALMSPAPRRETLGRPMAVASSGAMLATGTAALVLMLASVTQFAGLSVGVQLAYVAFAAGLGFVAFAGHLLVAERRFRGAMVGLAVVLAAASVVDVVRASAMSPLTSGVHAMRSGTALLTVLATFAVGALMMWRANADAEAIPFEMVGRGSSLADSASVALLGNDVRTLLVLQRSMATQPWRLRPVVRIRTRFARRFPVLGRTLRSIARWRVYRWLFVIATSAAIGGLVRVQPSNIRTTVLSGFALWMLGLALGEPLAQEHDRLDRLWLMPRSRAIEYRHVAVAWSIALVWLLAVLAVALHGRASGSSTIALAIAAASACTAAATISFRRQWKSLINPDVALVAPESAGAGILIDVALPAIVATICLSQWWAHASGPAIAVPGLVVVAGVVLWIHTNGFR